MQKGNKKGYSQSYSPLFDLSHTLVYKLHTKYKFEFSSKKNNSFKNLNVLFSNSIGISLFLSERDKIFC